MKILFFYSEFLSKNKYKFLTSIKIFLKYLSNRTNEIAMHKKYMNNNIAMQLFPTVVVLIHLFIYTCS